ncbi:MAG: PP2C family serine/threonine-protein phosphatase [Candidatus Electrothrix sp. Rat3]|nr:PP2C family serine/threonine-protein phosphatase [Candidatus Electrothrix rattekaaiensis]
MKEHIALRAACRDILNEQIPTEEELEQFLKSAAVIETLHSFSDELIQHWHTWKKGRNAPQDDVLSAVDQEQRENEEILADFQDGGDDDASFQDTVEVASKGTDTDDAQKQASPEQKEEKPPEPVEESIESIAPACDTTTDYAHTDTSEESPDPATTEAPRLLTDHSQHSGISTSPPPVPVDAPVDQDCQENQEQEASSPAPDSAVHHHHLPPQANTMKRDPSSSTVLFRLPNAMVSTPYSEPLAVENGEVMKITTIDGLEATGIRYNNETASVEGTPSKPGEFTLTVTYIMKSGGSGLGQLNFVVNHDPKSLWKNMPSDEHVKFWKPDQAAEEKEGYDSWKLIAASQRGRSHAHEGKCRDDDFMLINDHPEQWHILAVSDGAGSSQYAREGARIAVNTSATVLAEKLTEHNEALVEAVSAWDTEQSEKTDADLRKVLYSIFSQAIYQAINTVHLASKKEQVKFRDFYATLLLAAHKEIQGRHFIAGYWIGDGGMGVYKEGEDGYIKLLGEPDSGEYAGQTRFLDPEANDGEDIMRRISFTCVDSMTALFLLTDGITDPIFETDHNLQQPACWDKFWVEDIRQKLSNTPGETEKNLLDWLSFWSPGNHDDRTIALLYNKKWLCMLIKSSELAAGKKKPGHV